MTIRRILVPTDFSEHAAAAARFAARIAERERATITLLHVSGLADYSITLVEPVSLPLKSWEKLMRHELTRATARLDRIAWELAESVDGDLSVRTRIERGEVVKTIRQCAADEQSDLIVIASHGNSGALRYMFGSVAASVGRESPCPVLVTRPCAPGDRPPRRALVAVDYSALSEAATHLAADMVHAGGHVDLLHVWQEPPAFSGPHVDVGALRALEIDRMEEFAEVISLSDDIEVDLHVEIGDLTQRILRAADETRPDVIVIGCHPRQGIEKLVGTNTDRVLRHAELPVLLVPESGRHA